MSKASSRKVRAVAIAVTLLTGVGVSVIASQAFADETPGAHATTLRGGNRGGGGDRGGGNNGGGQTSGGGATSSLQPPGNVTAIGTFSVTSGTQNYTCTNGTLAAAAVPEAQLAGSLGTIHHFGGPSWQFQDGSTVVAAKVGESAVPNAVPQLLLKVSSHSGPTGLMSNVVFIQRLNTSGGAAPAGACTADAHVQYHADYVLFVAR